MSYLDFETRDVGLNDRDGVLVANSMAEIRDRLNRHFGWIPERHRDQLVRRWFGRRAESAEGPEKKREGCGAEKTSVPHPLQGLDSSATISGISSRRVAARSSGSGCVLVQRFQRSSSLPPESAAMRSQSSGAA